jgi:hypothetical protein
MKLSSLLNLLPVFLFYSCRDKTGGPFDYMEDQQSVANFLFDHWWLVFVILILFVVYNIWRKER